jgi:protein-L-isoaspartate(D-aspartate) O-methyltransferase
MSDALRQVLAGSGTVRHRLVERCGNRRLLWIGSTMDGEDAHPLRTEAIDALLAELRRQGIRDERVLAAIARVDRARFVPARHRDQAWRNIALPIGAGQTISQPYVVALMSEALALAGGEHVLEVGTGSGYQAAILAELGAVVDSIEQDRRLAAAAAARLHELGYRRVAVHVGDGTLGWPDRAPYDRIIVTAAAPWIPPPLRRQLRPDGGRLVLPVGDAREQTIVVVERQGDSTLEHRLTPVRFVPLIGQAGWAAPIQKNGHRGGEARSATDEP